MARGERPREGARDGHPKPSEEHAPRLSPAARRLGVIGVIGFGAVALVWLLGALGSTSTAGLVEPPAGTGASGDPAAVTSVLAAADAGASAIGTASYPVPAGAVFVSTSGKDSNPGTEKAPLRTLSRALQVARSDGTVVVRGGTYHQGSVSITKAVTVQNYPGETVWFDGARTVSGFTASGSVWALSGWTPVFDHSPTYTKGAADGTSAGWQWVNPSYPMAAYPDMVWVGGSALTQVGSQSAVVAGTFYVDTANHVLYVGTNPTSSKVEASDIQQFGSIHTTGVTLRGFGIRRYATSVPQMGALTVYGSGATLENMVVSDNATQGVGIGVVGVTLRHVTAVRNGLLGIQAAYADGIVLDGVDAEYNDNEHFNAAPNAGGIKVGRSRGVTIKNSIVSRNYGQGFWCDESCYNMTIVGNDVVANNNVGIFTEISDTGTIANNLVTDNKDDGLRIANTGNMQVWNNTLARNKRDVSVTQDSRKQTDLSTPGHDPRQTLPDPTMPWLAAHLTFRDNLLDNGSGNALLGVEDFTFTYTCEQLSISTDYNAYVRASSTAPTWLVVWSAGSGNNHNPYVYTTLSAFQTAKSQEPHSVIATSASAVPAFTPAALPAAVAALVGQASGTQHLGAWS